MPLSTIFQLYSGGHSPVSFIGGGNLSNRRKAPTFNFLYFCLKWLYN